MISLAEVLEFKFPNTEGIRTREKADHPEPFDPFRDMEIFDWPAAATGRPAPAGEELAAWRTEFEVRPVEKPPLDARELAEVLVAKLVITAADIDAKKDAR